MLLSLPFLYTVGLRRGAQRRARDYTVRGYTLVEIPEIQAGDLTEVLRCDGFRFDYLVGDYMPISLPYFAWRDVLVRRIDQDAGPVTGQMLQDALADGAEHRLYMTLFGWAQVPHRGLRHSSYDPTLNPLRYPTLGSLLIEMGIEAHPVERSDFLEREADAQIHLPRAIALVDGAAHWEVPEPVWDNDRFGKFNFAPEAGDAFTSYRLDRVQIPEDAFTQERTRITVARPDLLRRDDVVELTRCAIAHWPKWRMRALSAGGKIAGPKGLFEIVEGIVAKATTPTPEQCVAVLETYCLSRTLLTAQGQKFWNRGYSVPDRAGAIASRWRAEREEFRRSHPGLIERHEAYVAQFGGLELSEADIEALADIT